MPDPEWSDDFGGTQSGTSPSESDDDSVRNNPTADKRTVLMERAVRALIKWQKDRKHKDRIGK